MEALIINLISGALGGNAAGKLFQNLSKIKNQKFKVQFQN